MDTIQQAQNQQPVNQDENDDDDEDFTLDDQEREHNVSCEIVIDT